MQKKNEFRIKSMMKLVHYSLFKMTKILYFDLNLFFTIVAPVVTFVVTVTVEVTVKIRVRSNNLLFKKSKSNSNNEPLP